MYKNSDIQTKTSLDLLFNPRTVAHVGASPKSAAGRFNFTLYLMEMKYKGNLYPVNPKYDEVLGLHCYPDLSSIPEDVDLAILALPATHCPAILRDIPPGKLKFVVIHTSGFGEINKNSLEEEVLTLAKEKGFRIIGPNCMGIYSQQGRIGFWNDHKEIADTPGAVGLISQSGGHAINVVNSGMDSGIYFNKVISLGNQIDLSIIEALEYMAEDPSIGVIGIYTEYIREGSRFHRLLRDVTRQKPVVIWKGGISTVGKAAAATHTGSIAGDDKIFAAAMKQVGAVMAEDMSEFVRLIRLLQPDFELPGEHLAVFSPGGGNTVNISDLFSAQQNISLPQLTQETQEKLKAILPEENVDIKNPVDPGAVGSMHLNQLFTIVGADPKIESILMLLPVEFLGNMGGGGENAEMIAEMMASVLKEHAKMSGKHVYIMVQMMRRNHEKIDKYKRLVINKYNEKRIPWVDGSFKDAAVIFSKLAGYRRYLGSTA